MAYVMIDDGKLSGVARPPSGNQRGMRDGLGPHLERASGTFYAPLGVLGHRNGQLSGPLKLTIEHLGRSQKGLAGLGEAGPISDSEARARIQQIFLDTTAQWSTLLDQALNDMPVFPILTMNGARSFLRDAQAKITSEVNPTGLAVIRDSSIPLTEVQSRINIFCRNYLDNLQGQIVNAQQDAKLFTMRELLNSLSASIQVVITAAVQAAVAGASAAATSLPPWALPTAGIVLFAYVWSQFRR